MEPISPHTVITAARAARAADGSFFTIKNYIKRKILLYPGHESRAGQPRAFLVWGAYEFAVLISLQRHGLSLDAARAVWCEIIRQQLVDEMDADRAATGRESLLTLRELQGHQRKLLPQDADNTPPRNLPNILSGDPDGPIAAIRIKSHQHGVEGAFQVSIRPISQRLMAEWGQKWPGEWKMLIGSEERAVPAAQTQLLGAALFVNLNAVIWQVNQGLATQAKEDA